MYFLQMQNMQLILLTHTVVCSAQKYVENLNVCFIKILMGLLT